MSFYLATRLMPGESSREPRLSVVIPTRNRLNRLDHLLNCVLSEPVVDDIVVVDDRSSDGTDAYLDRRARKVSRLRRIAGPGQGPLIARMTGVSASFHDIVLLLDDDVRPEPGLCAGHLAHHVGGEDRLVLGYMPTVVPSPPTRGDFATRLYAAEYEGRCAEYERDKEDVLRHLWMGNMSVGRERFLEATERWPAPLPRFRHEDTEIGLRLASLGVTPLFDRTLLAWHEHRRTLAQFRRDCQLDGAGLAQLDRDGRDVFGPPGPARFSAGLPFPLRQLLVASARPTVYRLTASIVSVALSAAGAARAFGTETALARLLRRLDRQHGYLGELASAKDA
jgi:glycosyltransferase involved in cell wall biosynthesis